MYSSLWCICAESLILSGLYRKRCRHMSVILLTCIGILNCVTVKNKPPALQGEGRSSDQSKTRARIKVGLQTTNKLTREVCRMGTENSPYKMGMQVSHSIPGTRNVDSHTYISGSHASQRSSANFFPSDIPLFLIRNTLEVFLPAYVYDPGTLQPL